jgi:hypothetical protein
MSTNNIFFISIVIVVCVWAHNQTQHSNTIDPTVQTTLTFDSINKTMDRIDYKLDELISRKENGK